MSEWLRFDEVFATGKTKVWHVVSKSRGSVLGEIRWYGAWRQYVFFPARECLFNRGCLNDIAAFLQDAMDRRRPMSTGAPREPHARKGERG